MKNLCFLVCLFFMFICPVSAWDGFDYESGNFIEIEHGQYVRSGRDIDIFDYGTGEYKTVEVQSVSDREVEVFDYDNCEFRTFDMD